MYQGKKHIIITVLIWLPMFVMKAQSDLGYTKIDSLTYKLYQEKNWSVLASFCEKVISPEMDYYYLRMRAGIANYELGKYRAAAKHFEKAKLFNSSDAITNSYLQYAYLYCNRLEEAKQIDQFIKNPAFKLKYNSIAFESGIKTTSRPNVRTASLNGITLTHGIGKKATLMHSLNSYLQNEDRYNVQQLQYYLRYTVALKGNFKLQIGGHYVFSNVMPKNYLVYEPPGFTHKPPPLTQTILNIPANGISYTTVILPTHKNYEYIVSVNLIKHDEKIDLNFGTTLNKLDTTNLQMVNAGFVFFPFSNNDFQIGFQTYGYTFTQTSNWHFAFAPSITVKIFDKCYLQANFFKNQNVNIVEQCGMIFNNSIDYTNQRISISPTYILSNKLSFYGTYFIEQKRHLNDGTNYTYHLFLLGTKYNF